MRSQLETASSHSDDHWIPLSDLMTGLMMIFLLVAIVYMIKVEADSHLIKEAKAQLEEHAKNVESQSKKMKDIAIVYQQQKTELYDDLLKEFARDLPRWGAEMDRDATIRFKEPDVLFNSGSWELKPQFKGILSEFFPRYAAILYSEKYRSDIQEVRIEGHTSSFWIGARSDQEKYFLNMKLSQDRTRSTLEYVMGSENDSDRRQWLREQVTANGLSYAKTIKRNDGKEDIARSQRVEFRVRTNSEIRLGRIIEAAQ
jgi:outer membrane protein OmpA-like peptidoglycan-associated protein